MTEYIMVVGLAAVIFLTMGPLFKRAVQSIVKLTADQIAPQQNAEQRITPLSGYLVENYTNVGYAHSKNTIENIGIINYAVDDYDVTISNSKVNLGFTNRYR